LRLGGDLVCRGAIWVFAAVGVCSCGYVSEDEGYGCHDTYNPCHDYRFL